MCVFVKQKINKAKYNLIISHTQVPTNPRYQFARATKNFFIKYVIIIIFVSPKKKYHMQISEIEHYQKKKKNFQDEE